MVGYVPDSFSQQAAVLAACSLLAVLVLTDELRFQAPAIGGVLIFLPFLVESPIGRVAAVFLGIGSLVGLVKAQKWQKAGAAFWGVGLVFSALWLMDWIYGRFESQIELGPFLNLFVGLISFGWVHIDGNTVAIPADGRDEIVRMGLDKFGGLFLLSLYTLAFLLEKFRTVSTWSKIQTILIITVFAAVRCLILFGGSSGVQGENWWDEQNLLISFAPLCLILAMRVFATKRLENPATLRRTPLGLAIAAVASALIAVGIFFPTLGSDKKGWVVLDESHSDWEKSGDPINDHNFGTGTVYNYYNFRQELAKHFPVRVEQKEISDASLAGASVLILKTPTRPYSPDAVASIQRFVARGGGLWMIGDHTDAFGMSTNLNQVASTFGCKFRINAWVEPPMQRNLWQGDLSTHPIVQHMGTFVFYTGCELEAQPQDTVLIAPRRMIVENADYSAGSFFGPLRSAASNRFGTVIAAASGDRGRGRILLWADSTVFSNFVIYFPGKLELALNSVEWLNRENSLPLQHSLLLGSGVVLLVVASFLCSGLDMIAFLFIGMAASPLLIFMFDRIQGLKQSNTAVQGSLVTYLELTHTFQLPHYAAIDGMGPNYYVSAFVAAQRVGRRPLIAETIADGERADTMVLLPPPEELGKERIRDLLSWVNGGGKLVLADSGKLSMKDLSTFAQSLHVDIPRAQGLPKFLVTAQSKPLGKHDIVFYIEGGTPLVLTDNGKTVCSSIPFGKGRVILSGAFELFSDESTGDILGTPDAYQANALKLFCQILRSKPK